MASRNGKGTTTVINIDLNGLKNNVDTFKSIYTDIEAKKGITFKSTVCFDMCELAKSKQNGGDVAVTYCNKAELKLAVDLLTKLDIKYSIITAN